MQVRAWRVSDTGLVAAPGRFRRLPGVVRHHQGRGPAWPRELVLEVGDGELVVTSSDGDEVGRWPLDQVQGRRVADGPPVQLVVDVDGAAHLLALAADEATAALVAALEAADRLAR